MAKAGARTGAIISSSSDTKTVEFAGYGVYVGDEIPPKGIIFMGQDLHELERMNPRINLDNGHTIWGCQCWWSAEEIIKNQLEEYKKAGYTINIIDPSVYEVV